MEDAAGVHRGAASRRPAAPGHLGQLSRRARRCSRSSTTCSARSIAPIGRQRPRDGSLSFRRSGSLSRPAATDGENGRSRTGFARRRRRRHRRRHGGRGGRATRSCGCCRARPCAIGRPASGVRQSRPTSPSCSARARATASSRRRSSAAACRPTSTRASASSTRTRFRTPWRCCGSWPIRRPISGRPPSCDRGSCGCPTMA